MPLPQIIRKRPFVQDLLIAAALLLPFVTIEGVELLGPVRDISVAANQHREVTFMIHIAKNFRPPEKTQLQLLSGDRPAASVTVSP